MTNTTNESEAMEVWRKAKAAWDRQFTRTTMDQAAARVIDTALEARDAEIAAKEAEIARLLQFDEDWFADVIDDSIDTDWTGRVAARLIIARMAKEQRDALD